MCCIDGLNPQAKADTAAYGKMDMLSVLLHEYGHALGIEHSADNHDYMATTLTPGVRRMPSAEEMALMQSLVAQIKGEVVAGVTDSTPTPALPLQGGGGLDPAGRGLRHGLYRAYAQEQPGRVGNLLPT